MSLLHAFILLIFLKSDPIYKKQVLTIVDFLECYQISLVCSLTNRKADQMILTLRNRVGNG